MKIDYDRAAKMRIIMKNRVWAVSHSSDSMYILFHRLLSDHFHYCQTPFFHLAFAFRHYGLHIDYSGVYTGIKSIKIRNKQTFFSG